MNADFLLIMKMKQGNDDAFDSFVRKYYEDILKYCKYRCFDLEAAQDLTQETFLKFFANFSNYHYKGKTKNYLYTIAGNLCKNFYKKNKELPMEGEELEKVSDSTANALNDVLNKVIIESAVKRLSPEFQEVIVLFYCQELKLSEIADILQISLPLVKYRLRQAKGKLKQLIGEEEYDESGKKDGVVSKTSACNSR